MLVWKGDTVPQRLQRSNSRESSHVLGKNGVSQFMDLLVKRRRRQERSGHSCTNATDCWLERDVDTFHHGATSTRYVLTLIMTLTGASGYTMSAMI